MTSEVILLSDTSMTLMGGYATRRKDTGLLFGTGTLTDTFVQRGTIQIIITGMMCVDMIGMIVGDMMIGATDVVIGTEK